MQRAAQYIIFALCLLPWLILQLNIHPPGDASFLLFGAEHLLNGHSMTGYFYDNNPPMSFLIFTPATLLNHLSITPTYMLITFYTTAVIVMASICMAIILRYRTDLPQNTKFIIFTSFAIATTITHMAEFGQKDHLIAIGLIPFIFIQNSITQKNQPPLAYTFLILLIFVPFILIKPHYGIIPVAIILHRAITQKRLNIMRNIDLIVLCIGTASYIAYTLILMPEFLHEVLPMSIKLYTLAPASDELSPIFKTFIFIFTSTAFLGMIWLQDRNKKEKDLGVFIAIAAILSVIPFGIQNKGFSLHLLPTISLFIMGIGLYLIPYIKKNIILIPVIISATLYLYIWVSFGATNRLITHTQFENSQLAKTIKTHTNDKPFFIEDTTSCASFISSQYINNKIASRFPSMWFLESALLLEENDKIETLETFGNYIAEDFERHQPKMIAFMLNEKGQSPLKVIYKNHPRIQESLAHYKYKETVKINNIDKCTRAHKNKDNKLSLEIHTLRE
ncbi:MAG: hypothetical protein ACRBDI_00135 [Alphaproteobacteria bacterium]